MKGRRSLSLHAAGADLQQRPPGGVVRAFGHGFVEGSSMYMAAHLLHCSGSDKATHPALYSAESARTVFSPTKELGFTVSLKRGHVSPTVETVLHAFCTLASETQLVYASASWCATQSH